VAEGLEFDDEPLGFFRRVATYDWARLRSMPYRQTPEGFLGWRDRAAGGHDGRRVMTERLNPGIDCADAGAKVPEREPKREPFSAVLEASPGTVRQCSTR
jgi:hypothetical protein